MEGLNKKEEIFKDVLQNNEVQINTTDLWSDISEQLPKKRDRKPFIWFFTGLLSGVMIILLFIYMGDFPFLNNNSLVESTEQKKQNENKASLLSEKTLLHANENNSIESSRTTNEIVNNSKTLNEGTVLGTSNNSSITAHSKAIHKRKTSSYSRPAILFNPVVPEMDVSKMLGIFSPREVSASRSFLIPASKIESLSLIAFAPSKLIEKQAQFSPISVSKNSQGAWINALQLRFGSAKSFNTYSQASGEREALDALSENEDALYGVQTDFRFERRHRSGWAWIAGISYNTNASVFKDQSYSVNTITEIQERELIDNNGFREVEEVMVERTVEEIRNSQTHRVSNQLDIQLGISKSLLTIQRFSLSADALISYNIWARHRGYFFDVDNQTIRKFAAADDHPIQIQFWMVKTADT